MHKNIYVKNDWNLHLNLFQAAYLWASSKNFYEIKSVYQSFEGNFIKNILRINNIIRDIMVASEITKNDELRLCNSRLLQKDAELRLCNNRLL